MQLSLPQPRVFRSQRTCLCGGFVRSCTWLPAYRDTKTSHAQKKPTDRFETTSVYFLRRTMRVGSVGCVIFLKTLGCRCRCCCRCCSRCCYSCCCFVIVVVVVVVVKYYHSLDDKHYSRYHFIRLFFHITSIHNCSIVLLLLSDVVISLINSYQNVTKIILIKRWTSDIMTNH